MQLKSKQNHRCDHLDLNGVLSAISPCPELELWMAWVCLEEEHAGKGSLEVRNCWATNTISNENHNRSWVIGHFSFSRITLKNTEKLIWKVKSIFCFFGVVLPESSLLFPDLVSAAQMTACAVWFLVFWVHFSCASDPSPPLTLLIKSHGGSSPPLYSSLFGMYLTQ